MKLPASKTRVVLLALLIAVPIVARAENQPRSQRDGSGFLSALWTRVQTDLEAASAELEPPLEPPVAVKVKWRANRISSVDLKAPLLAVVAGDVDGDEKAEIIALTTREVAVIEQRGRRKLAIIGRVSLPAAPAKIRPRDPVGTLVVADGDGDGTVEILARSSDQEEGGSYSFQSGSLREVSRLVGFPLGQGANGELEAGRNYFTASKVTYPKGADAPPMPERFYSAPYRDDLVDPEGRPLRVHGFVAIDGSLSLRFEKTCRASDDPCKRSAVVDKVVGKAGVAVALGDINNDGRPEVIISSNRAPGDPDRVTVFTPRGTRFDKVYSRKFNGGVVALTVGDLNGDGALNVIVAVRLVGSTRVDLWTLN